jgi:hypothetical protein
LTAKSSRRKQSHFHEVGPQLKKDFQLRTMKSQAM